MQSHLNMDRIQQGESKTSCLFFPAKEIYDQKTETPFWTIAHHYFITKSQVRSYLSSSTSSLLMSPPPSFSPLATYQDGGAGVVFKEKQKKKRGRKREFSFYCSYKTCPGQSVIQTGRFNCIISSFFYFTDLLFHLQIIYRYTITFIYFQLWLNRINVCTALKKCL